MLKRVIAYILNILILKIPIVIVYIFLSEYLYSWRIIDKPGVQVFGVIIQVLFPIYILTLLIAENTRIIHLLIPSISLILLILMDSIISFFFQGDLGKKIFGLKIISMTGKKVNFTEMLIRTLIKYTAISILPIVFIYPALNKTHKTLHDMIAKTKVVTR